MADKEHRNLTGADLHEPKGVATAAANTVYRATGAGTGVWTDIAAELKAGNRVALTTRIDDISTASSVWAVSPIAGDVIGIYVVLHNAITVADAVVTAELNGVAMSGLSITCAYTGSAAGSTFSGTPSGSNTVSSGDAIEIITDGGSTTACKADVTIMIDTA